MFITCLRVDNFDTLVKCQRSTVRLTIGDHNVQMDRDVQISVFSTF